MLCCSEFSVFVRSLFDYTHGHERQKLPIRDTLSAVCLNAAPPMAARPPPDEPAARLAALEGCTSALLSNMHLLLTGGPIPTSGAAVGVGGARVAAAAAAIGVAAPRLLALIQELKVELSLAGR